MAATIATLLELQWNPVLPDYWLAPGGEEAAQLKEEGGAYQEILEAVQRGAQKTAWEQASNHFGGKGLEEGHPGMKHAEWLQDKMRKEKKFDIAKAIDIAVTGGAFTGDRLLVKQRCARCGGEDTGWHKYYDCPALDTMEDDEEGTLKRTSWLKNEIQKPEQAKWECLYLRGLIPASMLTESEGRDPFSKLCHRALAK